MWGITPMSPTPPKKTSLFEKISSIFANQKPKDFVSDARARPQGAYEAKGSQVREAEQISPAVEELLEKNAPTDKIGTARNVYKELVISEKGYINNLKALIGNRDAMLAAYKNADLVGSEGKATKGELNDLFNKAQAVLAQNEALLAVLQTNSDPQEWAKQFAKLSEAYCNYSLSNENINAKGLPESVEKAFKKPDDSTIGNFNSYIVLPTQRLPRYSLLLNELNKNLNNSPDIASASSAAAEAVINMNGKLAERKALADAIKFSQKNTATLNLMELMKPLPSEAVFYLLKELQFDKIKFKNKADREVAQSIYSAFQKEAEKPSTPPLSSKEVLDKCYKAQEDSYIKLMKTEGIDSKTVVKLAKELAQFRRDFSRMVDSQQQPSDRLSSLEQASLGKEKKGLFYSAAEKFGLGEKKDKKVQAKLSDQPSNGSSRNPPKPGHS